MAGGRFRCLSCLLAYTAALLLGVSRHDVEASEGKQVIHKRVGDSVELLSNLPAEGVTSVEWRYKNTRVAIKGSGVIRNNPFKDRAKFNNITFSLTIRDLTLQDSGEFNLITEVKDHPGSVFITLQVHEPISTNPNVFSNITQPGPNGFCTVFLECKANPHSNVTYIWTVGNQSSNGPRLQYNITPQDGDTTFTCNASNVVSEKLASETLRCSNTTGPTGSNEELTKHITLHKNAVGGLLIIIIIIVVSGCLCKRRWSVTNVNSLAGYPQQQALLPNTPNMTVSVVSNRRHICKDGPQTIYDKIQIERMRKASVSPYQEVS
uniref:Ig-like domain-containing protein n=1 Tax=Poecilia formosa TaxID=48698 RepID=A0A096M320_POEFO